MRSQNFLSHYASGISALGDHGISPTIIFLESNEDVLLYGTGHIPGAVHIDWVGDLNDPLVRDYLDGEHFAQLMEKHGIRPETTVIFYGDKNNWWACYAFLVFQLFGHTNAKVMNGGRAKWVAEGRPPCRRPARGRVPRCSLPGPPPHHPVRAWRAAGIRTIRKNRRPDSRNEPPHPNAWRLRGSDRRPRRSETG